MGKRGAGRAAGLLLAVASSGCGGGLAEAEAQFAAGHYAAAKQRLAALGERESGGDTGHARVALYRGLTFGALGDTGRARFWLARAKAIEDARPGTLCPGDALRLAVAVAFAP